MCVQLNSLPGEHAGSPLDRPEPPGLTNMDEQVRRRMKERGCVLIISCGVHCVERGVHSVIVFLFPVHGAMFRTWSRKQNASRIGAVYALLMNLENTMKLPLNRFGND